MPSKLTYNQLENIIYINSLNTCHYISGYNGKKSKVIVKCEIHNYEFETKFENLCRASRPHHVCPHCKQSDRDSTKITSTCDFCNKEYFIRKGKMNNKTGFNFCCRKCKDSAQALVSGYSFQSLRPTHYSLSLLDSYDYRKKALAYYPNKCSVCNYNEDISILEVHHIDENRKNNKLENLIILCPNCHKKLTIHKYKLIDRNCIIKK